MVHGTNTRHVALLNLLPTNDQPLAVLTDVVIIIKASTDGKTHPSLGFGRSESLSDSSVDMVSLEIMRDFGTEYSCFPLFFGVFSFLAVDFLPRLRGLSSPEPGKISFFVKSKSTNYSIQTFFCPCRNLMNNFSNNVRLT